MDVAVDVQWRDDVEVECVQDLCDVTVGAVVFEELEMK